MPRCLLRQLVVLTALLCGLFSNGDVVTSQSVLYAAPADDEYALGVTLYGQKRWELAAEAFQTFIKNHSEHGQIPLAKLYLVQCNVNLQKYAEARTELRSFLKAYPDNKNLHQALYRVAECSYFLDDFPAAVQEFEAFLEAAPKDPLREWALPYLADSYLRNQQADKSLVAFQKSLAEFPQGRFVDDSRFGLARSHELLKQPEPAMEIYQQLIENEKSRRAPEALLNLGMLYFQQKDYPKADVLFTSLEQKFPGHPLIPLSRLNAGYASYSQKHWEAALQHFQAAAATPQYSDTARYWLAQTHKANGHWSEAEKVLLELKDSTSEELKPRVAYQLAESLFHQQRYLEAAQSYQNFLQQWPVSELSQEAWLNGIECLLLGQAASEAWQLSQTAVEFRLSPAGQRELGLLKARILSGKAELPAEAGVPQSRPERLQQAAALLAPLLESEGAEPLDLLKQQVRVQAAQIQRELNHDQQVVEVLAPLTTKPAEGFQLLIPEAWLLLATSLFELEDYQATIKAINQFETASTTSPQNSTRVETAAVGLLQGAFLKFNSLLKTSELELAEAELKKIESLETDLEKKSSALFQLADASYSKADWSRAARLYQRLLEANPAEAWQIKAMSALGWTQFEQEQFETASQTFLTLQQKYPTSRQAAADAGYMQGMAELKAGKNEAAANHFLETAQKFKTSEEQAQGDEISFIAYRSAREAARVFRQLNQIPSAAVAYQLAYQELAKQSAERKQDLDKLLDEWALLHYENDQFQQADQVFRILIEQTPDSDRADDARLSLAESDYIAGRVEEAKTMLSELVTSEKSDPYVKRRARFQLLLISSEQRDFAATRKHAEAYLAEADLDEIELEELGDVESHLIQCELQENQLATARERVDRLTKRLEGRKSLETLKWLPNFYVQSAELARREKNYPLARELRNKIAEISPDAPEKEQLEVIVGRTFIAEADFPKAQEIFQGVLERAAGKKTLSAAQSQFYLAEAALMKKDYETAIKEYIRVAALFTGFPDLQTAALFQAGQCDEVLGHTEQAIASYETLLRSFPQSEFAPKAQERLEKLKGNPPANNP